MTEHTLDGPRTTMRFPARFDVEWDPTAGEARIILKVGEVEAVGEVLYLHGDENSADGAIRRVLDAYTDAADGDLNG